jgi:hypothetical protein
MILKMLSAKFYLAQPLRSMFDMAEQTIAEKIQFQLQFMGMMGMCGRAEMADKAYIKAQELTAELIELEKLNANLERVGL